MIPVLPSGPCLSTGFLGPGWLHSSCPQLPFSQQAQGCGFYPSCALSPHTRAFGVHLSLLSASWGEVGRGWHPVVPGQKAGLFPELAEELEGAWQMASRAAPAPWPWVAVICHPHSGCGLGWQHPPCSLASGPRALRLGFLLRIAFDF